MKNEARGERGEDRAESKMREVVDRARRAEKRGHSRRRLNKSNLFLFATQSLQYLFFFKFGKISYRKQNTILF